MLFDAVCHGYAPDICAERPRQQACSRSNSRSLNAVLEFSSRADLGLSSLREATGCAEVYEECSLQCTLDRGMLA